MIFVTVGTTRFDEMVEAIDRIAPRLDEEVVVQIGNSQYLPNNCKYFTFDSDLQKHFEEADIVIAHGGAGITFEVLNLGKRMISLDNPHVLNGHQRDLLGKLSMDDYLIWCKDLNDIEDCIRNAKNSAPKKYKKPKCEIADIILDFLR